MAYHEMAVYNTILKAVARISARMFVGLPLCRNEEWLDISVHYTENVFKTVMALRMFPKFFHPVLVWLVPSSYSIHNNLRRARKLIVPLVNERLIAQATEGNTHRRPDDMLQWMMDAANEDEANPFKLAHRQLILTLGAIHTTTMAATHALFDLAAHPQYIAPIREEAESALLAEGAWDKSMLTRLRKMDSFLKESQRFNPPNICTFSIHPKSARSALTICSCLQPRSCRPPHLIRRQAYPKRHALRRTLSCDLDGSHSRA